MNCENCKKEHAGEYGSGRFCSQKCSRSFSTKIGRLETNKKVSNTLKKKFASGQFKPIKPFKTGEDDRRTKRHIKGVYKHSDSTIQKIKTKLKDISDKNFQRKIDTIPFVSLSKALRRKIIIKERGEKCECCGIENWLEQKLSFEIDHIDGDRCNNTKNNLRLLCPNCHSLTSTWRGKNITTRIHKTEFLKALNSTENIHQALKLLDLNPAGGNYSTAKKLLIENGRRDPIRTDKG